MMDTALSFNRRLSSGQFGQRELVGQLERLGFCVMETGQESWMGKIVHAALRYEHSDLMVRATRYMPDLLAYHPDFPLAYWEVKTNNTPGTPFYAIEKACYEEAMARTKKGERIVFTFQEVDRTWHTNWVQCLEIGRDMSAVRSFARGSHTPYLLIPKTCVLPLIDFLETSGRTGTWLTI